MTEHQTEQVFYCADCSARDVETVMVADSDFGGHLCPVCEPLDVKLIGLPDQREARYARLHRTGSMTTNEEGS